MIIINFTLHNGLIQKKERDFLPHSFKTTRRILLEMVVALNMNLQKYGGQIGGIEQ
jgi:hypothetical protein